MMTRTWIRRAALAAATFTLTAMAAFAEPSSAALITVEQLEERARAARTAADHSAVAEGYEQLAASHRVRAAAHEKEAGRLIPRGYNPMMQKWPGLALGPANRERSRAMQARRAANEAAQNAQLHRERARTAAGTEAAGE